MNELWSPFIQAVIEGRVREVSRMLAENRGLATLAADEGASRRNASSFFFEEIAHYLMEGDTPLHMAAAAFQSAVAKQLVEAGATCSARNRRGAEPLHYAADANHWKPAAQRETINYLLSAGANANALDQSGVSPLHRAVRTRSSSAVQALLDGGADVQLRNKAGSTPLHLAVQDTGRSGAGENRARTEQRIIVGILLEAGARATDRNGGGKTALAVAPDHLKSLLKRVV